MNFTEDDYEDLLNDIYGWVEICGMKYEQGTALRRLDPIAFRCGYSDYVSSLEEDEASY